MNDRNSLFHSSPEAIFVLNRHRRILFVNRACEELLGLPLDEVIGLTCTRGASSGSSPLDALGFVLFPPARIHEGKPARVRRLSPAFVRPQRWWDIDFFPLLDGKGRPRILGKITPGPLEAVVEATASNAKLMPLLERSASRYGLDQVHGDLASMRRVVEQVRLAAKGQSPVLIVGEPGAGKEWTARALHHEGETRSRTFAALDCAHLPSAALAVTLFGERGLLSHPRTGTVYLKEIDRLPLDLQNRLGDWLEQPRAALPRLLAGTSIDLVRTRYAGQILESLHCALTVLVIALPPLRERLADLLWLVETMLERVGTEGNKRVTKLTAAAWETMSAYSWPRNLRELYSVLAGACHRARSEQIEVSDLPAYLRLGASVEPPVPAPRILSLESLLHQVERRIIVFALKRAHGNKSRVAEMLSISRAYLPRRMELLGIDPNEGKPGTALPPDEDEPTSPPAPSGNS